MGRREMQRPFYLQAHHGRTKTTRASSRKPLRLVC